MTRFYDAVDRSELAMVEALLKIGGVEYTVSCDENDFVCELMVAEEDLALADSLLARGATF